jgi:hypothetical protein
LAAGGVSSPRNFAASAAGWSRRSLAAKVSEMAEISVACKELTIYHKTINNPSL